MPHDNAMTCGDPGPARREPRAARRPSAGLRNHPKRMEGLTRRLARCQEELWGMQREAIIALDAAISRLGALDRCLISGAAIELLAELEAALDEVGILVHDKLPRPEHLFALADRLDRLNQVLSATSGVASGGGPADNGGDR